MSKKSKNRLFGVISLGIGMLAGLAIGELIFIGYFWIQDGMYLTVKEKLINEKNSFVTEMSESKDGCRYIDFLMPHPYVGFVMFNSPCHEVKRFNRAGFLGPEFPFKKPEDKYVILLTGGSVAAQLAGTGGNYFQEYLTNRFGKIDQKEIIVLNGALGAWRQPQQAILFMLFAEVVDAVITLDGFNENIAFNGVRRLEMPYGGNFSRVNPHLTFGYKKLVKSWMASKVYYFSLENGLVSKSKLAYFLSLKLRSGIINSIENNSKEGLHASGPLKHSVRISSFENMFRFPKGIKAAERFQKNLELYKKYISSIDTLSRQMKIKNLHFIQPVPAIGKKLTREELNLVGKMEYGPRYQKLTDGLLELKKDGVPIFSLLQIFKDVKESIYVDGIHCESKPIKNKRVCYDIMAGHIADQIEAKWDLKFDK